MRDSHLRRPRLLELLFGLAALGGAGLVTFGAPAPPGHPTSNTHPPPGFVAFRPNPRPLPGALGPVAVSGTINGAAQSVTCPVGDQGTVTCQITGTWSATLVFEATVDNLTWATVRANAIASDTLVTAPAANGLYVLAGNFTAVRVRDSAYTSGSAVVTMRATPSSSANIPISSVGGTGGGGGGGGAATIADGADITQGALADAAVGDATGSVNGHLRQIAKTLATAVPVTGTFFQATQPVSGTVTITPSGTQTVSGTVAATQSGTWTVQPGNTANTTAWKVDGSAVTQPVSGTVTITPSGTQTITGTVANSAGVATIGNVGGLTKNVDATLTRPANTTTYTANDELTDTGGGIQTITGAAVATGGSGIITHCLLSCSSNGATKPTFTVYVYDTTSTPQTDNAAFAPADAVQDTCVGSFTLSSAEVGDATSSTGNFTMDSGQIHIPFVTSGSANLFFRIKVTDGYTPGTNSDTYKWRYTVQEDAK